MIIQETLGDFHGVPLEQYTMKNALGMQVSVLNYGGIVRRILFPDSQGVWDNRVLAYQDIGFYEKNPMFFGAIIGRVAGRIRDAEFQLPGEIKHYFLEQNEGRCHLHGGSKGFCHQFWLVNAWSPAGKDVLNLRLTDLPQGGYPGRVEVLVQYTLDDENQWSIYYHVETDQPTICNMTNHTYFNLSGTHSMRKILQHRLAIAADVFGEVDEQTLPTGCYSSCDVEPVFDFRQERAIGRYGMTDHWQQQIVQGGYDHAFPFSNQGIFGLFDPISQIEIQGETSEESVIVYTCNKVSVPYLLEGGVLQQHSGITLETQALSDRIHSEFPQHVIVTPENPYNSVTSYKFSIRK
jgi:aldose 1-epimerase